LPETETAAKHSAVTGHRDGSIGPFLRCLGGIATSIILVIVVIINNGNNIRINIKSKPETSQIITRTEEHRRTRRKN